MELWKDLRFGARLLVKARWFTLAAGTALALGIGANTTVFTLVNAVLFRGLPFDDPESIVAVWAENGSDGPLWFHWEGGVTPEGPASRPRVSSLFAWPSS